MVVNKALGVRVKSIQGLIACDPKVAGAVLEQRGNVDSSQAVRAFGVVPEGSEPGTVIAVQPVARSQPDEALIILDDRGESYRRQLIGGGEASESDVLLFNDGEPHDTGVASRRDCLAVLRSGAVNENQCYQTPEGPEDILSA